MPRRKRPPGDYDSALSSTMIKRKKLFYLNEKKKKEERLNKKVKECLNEYDCYLDISSIKEILQKIYKNYQTDVNIVIMQYLTGSSSSPPPPHERFLAIVASLSEDKWYKFNFKFKNLYDKAKYNRKIHNKLVEKTKNTKYIRKNKIETVIDNYGVVCGSWNSWDLNSSDIQTLRYLGIIKDFLKTNCYKPKNFYS